MSAAEQEVLALFHRLTTTAQAFASGTLLSLLLGLLLRLLVPPLLLLRQVHHPHGSLTLVPLFI
jgi:hypothetical protein